MCVWCSLRGESTQFTCDMVRLDILVERQGCYERAGETLTGFHGPEGVTKRQSEKGGKGRAAKMMEDVILLKRLNSGDPWVTEDKENRLRDKKDTSLDRMAKEAELFFAYVCYRV